MIAVPSLTLFAFDSTTTMVLQGVKTSANAYNSIFIPTIFLFIMVVALILIINYVKESFKRNPVAQIDQEFRKEQDTLLALADARKRQREREAKEAEEQELIKKEIGELTIDLHDFLYKSCKHCLLEMDDDTEAVVLLDSQTGIHKACFSEFIAQNVESKCKYVYIWPEDKFMLFDEFAKTVS